MKNMSQIMKQVQQMQEKMKSTQELISKVEMEGISGAGLVKAVINGKNEICKLQIDKSLMSEDISMLEDLIIAAFNDAKNKIDQYTQEEMGKLTGGLPLPAGFQLPF